MASYFYSDVSTNLCNSLKRYFNYILGLELIDLSEASLIPDTDKHSILVHYEERRNIANLNQLQRFRNCNFIVLRYDRGPGVNLLSFDTLREQFLAALNPVVRAPLFTEEEMKELLMKFFTSHGGDSLFESLNWVGYYFRNGTEQFRMGNINYEEYLTFLSPGLKKWEGFRERVEKYRIIAGFSNFQRDFEHLNQAINFANEGILELKSLGEKKILEKCSDFFSGIVEKISDIDYILTEIHRNLGIGAPPLQSSTG